MTTGFYKLKIGELRQETADCVSLVLEVPEELRPVFKFIPGQHLIFRRKLENGEEIRRNYSICSCPEEEELRVAVKKISEGSYSTFINEQARAGDELEVMPPQGGFVVKPDPGRQKNYLAIAAGSGITPVISIMKTVLQTEPSSRFVLIYGNRQRSSIIFKEQIEALKNRFMERLSVYHVLSREKADLEILSGRIDGPKLNLFLSRLIDPDTLDEVLLCGPEGMISGCREALTTAGVDPANIHFELFYSAGAAAKKAERESLPASNGPVSRIHLKLDASTLAFDLPYDGESILDAALRNGADLPYACKGGVCATCKCKLEEGQVSMDVNYALEADELERGFILACQSHPRTSAVHINYDIK